MVVRINGQNAELETGMDLERLLAAYRLKKDQVVVELNRRVPAKDSYAAIRLAEGDEIEIVKFMGGG